MIEGFSIAGMAFTALAPQPPTATAPCAAGAEATETPGALSDLVFDLLNIVGRMDDSQGIHGEPSD